MSGKFEYVDFELSDGYTTTICCSDGCSTDFSSAGTFDYMCDNPCNKDSCKEKDHNCEKNCEPKNNDGRDTCYWCGAKTKLVDTGMRGFHYCEKCRK